MEYQVAIPSYKRPELLKIATLATLAKYGASSKLVTVFVANDQEYREYRKVVPSAISVVVAKPGLYPARRFYHGYYPAGTRLVNIDDDIRDFTQKAGSRVSGYEGSLEAIVETGFTLCEKYGSGLWGVNPTGNGFFMSDAAIVGLRYIGGGFYGNYAGDLSVADPSRQSVSSGEDYETTLRAFLIHGSVVKLDWLSFKTNNFAPGGMDSEVKDRGIPDRLMEHRAEMEAICARYPDLARMYWKAGDIPNIRLKAKTYAREPRI